ncbi:signal-transducing adaptor protein 1-like isoform X2 [Nerophis ophidion]|uniref:signal-transducing adaptor protein 1-like isoform X2 n=1 Tax=Nerophis ophidion TaxID=159077 RepID=UPI002AE00A7E|nr:signal-transducing adaptor protein 1-like isoform X2 [Nerophis ophidion]
MNEQPGRTVSQLPPCYHEGYLRKQSLYDKTSCQLWTRLCGNTLFFFNHKMDTTYLEKMDLSGLTNITNDTSVDINLNAASLKLQIQDITIRLSLSVSSSHILLPRQIVLLEDVVEKEKERQKNAQQRSSLNADPNVDMPDCFHPVSRMEAELLLTTKASRGNLLLRPSRHGDAFAISTREELNGPILKHYRVSRKHDNIFIIDVDNPVTCTSLPDTIKHFMDTSEGALKPLPREELYQKKLSFVAFDPECGEKILRTASMTVKPNLSTQPETNMKAPRKSKEPPVPARRKTLHSYQVSVCHQLIQENQGKIKIHKHSFG